VLVILTQAEIIEKIGSDVADAFADLYRQYLPKVYRYISYRISDRLTAEDLTSAVFEKALSKFRSYRSEKAGFSTWIFTIARNTLTDHFRVNRKGQNIQLDDPLALVAQDGSPEEVNERAEELQLLNSCLSRLSPAEREIISLKFGAEMTNRQISGILALSESNVGVIVYRAVRKLRDDFRERQNG
jgi:RNA polymerase sigma-70 factor (ECF subfamily)